MPGFFGDLCFGRRLLAKSPLFAATAALLLAVGISANTLIFSVVNALLLRPLPVSRPQNLVRLVEVHPNNFVTWTIPYNFCDAAAARDPDFSEVICQGEADVAFSDGAATERVRVHLVSPNFFSSLGVPAYIGRTLTAGDERGQAMNAVVSYGFWRRRLQGDVSAAGKRVILGGQPFTIVGVSPEGFNGLAVDTSPDIRVPAAVDRYLVKPSGDMHPAARPLFAQIFARLRPGVTFARAAAQVDPLLRQPYEEESEKIFPPAKGAAPAKGPYDTHLQLESIVNGVSTLRAQFSRGLEVLMAAVALLLLMACANVAGLLLARSTRRAPEMGIRLALGAGSGRIVRQLLTEGLLLAIMGGAGGMLLTLACLPLLVRALPPVRDRGAVLQPLAVHIRLDLHVLAFAVAVTFLTAILFAASPAWRCARADVASILRTDRTTTRRLLARNLIVTAQVAICTLLLMGAALLAGTLARMRSMNPGFDRDRVVTVTIDPALSGYTSAQSRALSKRLLEKAAGLPGVQAAGIASRALMRGTGVKATFGPAGSRIAPTDFLNSSLNEITPGYFETMGMRLLAGRAFNWFDRDPATPPRLVIVNQAFAKRFFPGQSALGRLFGYPGPGGVAAAGNEIIGVVSDAKYRSLREPVPPTVYSPVADRFDSAFILHVRTGQRPEAILPGLREALRSLDPGLPLLEVRTLREEVEASLWQERLLALLSTLFGAIAALLSSIGLYGALDYAVKSRAREIGLRMALGAQPARIAGLFTREALVCTGGGLLLGLCAYAAAAVWIRHVLYDLRPWEPTAVIAVVFLVSLIAAAATIPAAWRAVRIDPATALRAE
ncbi:MAG TPA: ADOP family duplicated permease [Bryobacteraceae bacterium]|nr:ADOP family duplicated permease [Bryobacteraceae bacterium]